LRRAVSPEAIEKINLDNRQYAWQDISLLISTQNLSHFPWHAFAGDQTIIKDVLELGQ